MIDGFVMTGGTERGERGRGIRGWGRGSGGGAERRRSIFSIYPDHPPPGSDRGGGD